MSRMLLDKTLTSAEKIYLALDGRSQTWLVDKIHDYAKNLPEEHRHKDHLSRFTDVKLSRKMKGRDEFEDCELEAISSIFKQVYTPIF